LPGPQSIALLLEAPDPFLKARLVGSGLSLCIPGARSLSHEVGHPLAQRLVLAQQLLGECAGVVELAAHRVQARAQRFSITRLGRGS
jgi:hypothetical protein